MNPREQVTELLQKHGATLTRSKKHEIWKLPNGKTFTRGSTPSDANADENGLTDLKRILGITKTVATVGVRRVKKVSRGRPENISYTRPNTNTGLSDKLRLTGLREAALQVEIQRLQGSIEAITHFRNKTERDLKFFMLLTERLNGIAEEQQHKINECLCCRIKNWLIQIKGKLSRNDISLLAENPPE